MSDSRQLVFRDHDTLGGIAPTIDGFALVDAGVVTDEPVESGYINAGRVSLGPGVLPPVVLQAVRHNDTLVLAISCRGDPSFDDADAITIALRQNGNSEDGPQRRIDIVPVWGDEPNPPYNAMDLGIGYGAANRSPDPTLHEVEAADIAQFDVRTNKPPHLDATYYQRAGKTGPWTTFTPDKHDNPASFDARVRSWKPTVAENTPAECAWGIEVRFPLAREAHEEVIGQRHSVVRFPYLMGGRGQRRGEVTAGCAGPPVVVPFDGFQECLPAQSGKAVFVAVVDAPPLSAWPFKQGGVALAPPRLVGIPRPDDGVAGAVLPRTMYRTRAGDRHHVPGGGTRRAAHRRREVKPVAAAGELWSFEGVRLRNPVIGVAPAVVDVLHWSVRSQSVVGEPDAADSAEEQIAAAVLSHRVPWIDMPFDAQVDRLAPGASHTLGMNDIRQHRCRRVRGDSSGNDRYVDKVPAVHFAHVDGKHAADGRGKGGPQRLPVQKIP